MDHQILKEKLFFYKDPETSEIDRCAVALHLEGCEECRGIVKRLEQIQTKLSQTTLKPSPNFVFQVMERLEPQTSEKAVQPTVFPAFLKWLFPALGYSFAVVLMFVVITHREMPVNTETILLSDMPQASQWTLGSQAPDAGALLDM